MAAETSDTEDRAPAQMMLVYDGDCGFCRATSAWLVRRGLIEEAQRRPFQAYGGEDRERLLQGGIRNELLVVLPDGTLRGGIDGLRVLFQTAGRRVPAWLLRGGPTRALASLGYRVLGRNRRVVAPMSRSQRAACACDPEPRLGDRLLFVGACLTFAFAVAALFGHVAGRGAATGLGALAVAVAPILLVLRLRGGERAGEGIAHFAWVLAGAALVELVALAPALLLAGALDLPPRAAVLGATLIGCAAFGWFAFRRWRVLAA